MRSRTWIVAGGLALTVIAVGAIAAGPISRIFDFRGAGGSLSPYLVGYYDGPARLYLVNPTALNLVGYVVLFDAAEQPLACTKRSFSANDLEIVDVEALVPTPQQGVIKVVSFDAARPGIRLQAGLKGWLRNGERQDDAVNQTTSNQTIIDPATNQTIGVQITILRTVSREIHFISDSQLTEVPDEVLRRDGNKDREPDELGLLLGFIHTSCA